MSIAVGARDRLMAWENTAPRNPLADGDVPRRAKRPVLGRAEPHPFTHREERTGRKIKAPERMVRTPVYLGYHSLRHDMASYLLDEKKRGLKTVRKLLRHKRVSTTERYLHPVRGLEREAMESIIDAFSEVPAAVLTEKRIASEMVELGS
jgi:integrase